jgi:signal transduction histidine kinase
MAVHQRWQRRRGGAWGITLIGVALGGATLAYGFRIVQTNVQSLVYPVIDFLTLLVLAGTVAYAGHRLATSDLGNDHLWQIAVWVGLGVIFMWLLSAWQLLMQLRHGVALVDPLIGFVVTQSVGAVAGLLVGVYHVHTVTNVRHAQAQAAQAQTREDRLAFLHTLLRHHLFNGMQVIQSYTDRLHDHVDDAGRSHIETIQTRSDRLVTLVENMDVLVHSLSEQVSLEPVDLVATARQEATHLDRTNGSTSITVTGPESLSIQADRLLPAAIENLLRSTIEHSDARPLALTVAIGVDAEMATLSISAPDHELGDHVPDPHERSVDAVGDTDQLDVFIARELIDRYGGTLTISDDDHRTFEVQFPLAQE